MGKHRQNVWNPNAYQDANCSGDKSTKSTDSNTRYSNRITDRNKDTDGNTKASDSDGNTDSVYRRRYSARRSTDPYWRLYSEP